LAFALADSFFFSFINDYTPESRMMCAVEKGILFVKLVYFLKWPCICHAFGLGQPD
jgi:hypothetical protein